MFFKPEHDDLFKYFTCYFPLNLSMLPFSTIMSKGEGQNNELGNYVFITFRHDMTERQIANHTGRVTLLNIYSQ